MITSVPKNESTIDKSNQSIIKRKQIYIYIYIYMTKYREHNIKYKSNMLTYDQHMTHDI